MAEEFEEESGKPADGVAAEAAALHVALSQDSPEARAYLRQQTEVGARQGRWLDVQMETLENLKHLEVSHLRWRRFNDQAKGALQIMTALMGALVLAGLAIAMWNASRADGIVVGEFSVPPAFAVTGITGAVVADDLTTKIAAIRDSANSVSLARSKDVRQDGEEIKVEIPETGISLSQAWRYLKLWLGHERRLDGNLRRLSDGPIVLSVSLDGEVFTQQGAADTLETLEEKAAEHVFARVDPMNTVLYLLGQNRIDEALAAAARLHTIFADGTPLQREESYALWAGLTRGAAGDPALAAARARLAIGIDPKDAAPHMELMEAAANLGHDEEALAQARLIGVMRNEDTGPTLQGHGFFRIAERGRVAHLVLQGDFAAALADPCAFDCSFSIRLLRRSEYAARLHDPAQSAALAAQALAGGGDGENAALPRYFAAMARQDWLQAAAAARAPGAALRGSDDDSVPLAPLLQRTQARPLLAEALARSGDFKGAHAAIDTTPGDCYPCLVTRGVIAGLEQNWGAADYWFKRALAAGPSLPFAPEAWGRALLAKGDAAGAASQFALAAINGPRFADALEGWGEALMAQNASHLAAVKFAAAARLAPNWKRLHLKWGEALLYAGKHDAAGKQFALAATLQGAPADGAELGFVRARSGL